MGKLFIVSGPSGVGKTTLVNAILSPLEKQPFIERVVTYTSKSPRPGEIPGLDYHFVSAQEFEAKIAQGFFLEWSKAYGNYYGSPRSIIEELVLGKSYVMILDINGAESVKAIFGQAILIWIIPKDMDTLRARLVGRKTEGDDQLNHRLSLADEEIKRQQSQKIFDYTLVNEDLDRSIARLRAVIASELSK